MRGNLYTLRNEIAGKENLNGKIFFVICKGPGNKAVFLEPGAKETPEVIWETTDVKSIENWEYDEMKGIKITTQNTVYTLLNISCIIPTMVRPRGVGYQSDIHIVDMKRSSKPIHYGDGYTAMDITFNRPLSRDEFIRYCKNDLKVAVNEKEKYPYGDYVVINGDGARWQWKEVHQYTD